MGKPAFDPNQPFESAKKPAFSPDQPYESAAGPSLADKAIAGIQNFGAGAGDLVRNQVTNANSAVQGLSNGVVAGYLPQIEGGLSAAGSAGLDALKGNFDSDKILKDYIAARDHAIGTQKQFHDDAPIGYNLGEMGGAMASPANEVLAPFKAAKGAGLLKKIAIGARNGAVTGGLMNPGDEIGEVAPIQFEKRLDNAEFGGALGGVLTGGIEGVKSGWKKGMTTLFGPTEEAIDKYVAGRERINKAPSVEALKDSIDQQVGEIAAAPHPREMASDVHQAVATLKDQVVAGSQASRDILAKSNIAVQTQPVIEAIDQAIQGHMIAGHEPPTKSGQQSLAALRDLREGLSKYPSMLGGEDAKSFVQMLDQDATYSHEAGGFGEKYDNALKEARRAIDKQLKGFKPYDDAMKIVAEKANLLNRANKMFGTPEKAHGAMNSIMGEGKLPQQELVQELGAHTGNDFSTPMSKYTASQESLKNLPGWGQNSTQGKLQGLISKGKPNIEAQRQLEALDAMRAKTSGEPSYMQSIDDNRVAKEFEGGQTRGARNALIWHSLGTAAGGAVGALVPGMYHIPMAIGGGAGAIAGGAVDKYGGQMAKGMLDHYLDNPALYTKAANIQASRVAAPWIMMRKKDGK